LQSPAKNETGRNSSTSHTATLQHKNYTIHELTLRGLDNSLAI